MAKTTKPAKKVNSTKNIRKPVKPFWQSKVAIVIFIIAFAAVGIALLLRTSAAPSDTASPFKGVMVEYQTTAAELAASKNNNGQWNYNVLPTQARLMYSGELICNNGSTDSMNSVKLSAGEVNSIKQSVKQQFDTVNDMATSQDAKHSTKINSDGEGIVLINEDGTPYKSVGVANQDGQKPAGFMAVKNMLKNQCQRAGRRTKIADLPVAGDRPTRTLFAAAAITLARKIMPIAYAGYSSNAESGALFQVNYHRNGENNSYGAPWAHPIHKNALTQRNCMVTTARQVAYFNYSANIGKSKVTLYHSSVSAMEGNCGKGWTGWGENLAFHTFGHSYTGSQMGKQGVLDLLIEGGGPEWGHHENIDNRGIEFTKIGNGAYIHDNGSYYALWLAQEFAVGDSGIYK